jgi:hypothetical protein
MDDDEMIRRKLRTAKNQFRVWVQALLTHLSDTPSALKQKHPELQSKLHKLCGSGQGLGNKTVEHEACFAYELEARGCAMYSKEARDGYFYVYQPNGTQQSIDFRVVCLEEGEIVDMIEFDLKHGSGASIYLNDGTFLNNVVYVITFSRTIPAVKKVSKRSSEVVCAIAVGQDVLTEKDRVCLEERFQLLKNINKRHDRDSTDYLRLYVRNANQYDCSGQFTREFTSDRFSRTLAWISQSQTHTETEPRFQSV